ncbi:putative serine esterase-domain-containing protein [Lentinula edodes]|nr:putative serine esterase-domain-containing protein [Lentinula edodes]
MPKPKENVSSSPGSTKHLEPAIRVFSARHCQPNSNSELAIESQNQVQVLLIEANQGSRTYDGIDWGAERAAEEIQEAIRKISSEGDRVTKFSITGYSLGGLYARYVLAIIYAKHFFDTVQPMNFTTFATPHIGIPDVKHSLFSYLSRCVGSRMLGNTGKQLYCLDRWGETGHLVFWKALNSFQNIDIYVNAVHDIMVPYVSGAFELLDPFEAHIDDIQVEFHSHYFPMLKSWTLRDDREHKISSSCLEHLEVWKPLPFMGPFIQWNFPFNLILMTLFPIIIPVVIVLLPITFALNTRSSGFRVKSLERASMSAQEKLAQIFATLDHSMMDMLEQPTPNNTSTSTTPDTISTVAEVKTTPISRKQPPTTITSNLSAAQQRMVVDLNQLPVRKHLTWIHPTRNSHAIIICREKDQFPGHALGEGVLRHWADHFTT